MADSKYFNFPIPLLRGFVGNPKKILNDICDYSLYQHSLKLVLGSELECFKAAANFYVIKLGDTKGSFENGEALFNSIDSGEANTGISLDVFWDYYKKAEHKTEFEKVCLLAHLAIKSIIGKSAYSKMTNDFWCSRMSGYSQNVNHSYWDSSIRLRFNNYQARKIKLELIRSWSLVTYSRHTKGFYVSYTLSLEELIIKAETKRKSNWVSDYKHKEKETIQAVLGKLNKGKK